MKVLLIWEEIPENTKLYSLEGELAELAVAAAGNFVNAALENEAVIALSEELTKLEPVGDGTMDIAFDISGHDKAVICGFIM